MTPFLLTQNGTFYIRSCIDGYARHRTFWAHVSFLAAILSEAMAASSGNGIPAQLAALLGRDVAHIRKTEEEPPRAAIYDVIAAVTGLTVNHAGKAYRDLVARHPEVHSMGMNFRFPGRGQRNTPVAPARIIFGAFWCPRYTAGSRPANQPASWPASL